jgi:hypothetical protein
MRQKMAKKQDAEKVPQRFWAVDDNEWRLVEGRIEYKIKPGLYQLVVRESFMGPPSITLAEMQPKTDKLFPLPDSLCEYIVKSIEKFWTNKFKYDQMGLVHKRGLLMEGAPGTGKTAICLLVGQEIGKRGGIAIFTSPKTAIGPLPRILKAVREMHPEMPLLNIMEDIDRHKREMDTLLPMLDGEDQVTNIVHLATTNFVDKLDDRLTGRPSRFDEVIKVKPLLKKAREAYLKKVFPDGVIPDDIMAKVLKHGNGLNFAYLKELAVSTYVYDVDPEVTAKKLKAQMENRPMGFKDEEGD